MHKKFLLLLPILFLSAVGLLFFTKQPTEISQSTNQQTEQTEQTEDIDTENSNVNSEKSEKEEQKPDNTNSNSQTQQTEQTEDIDIENSNFNSEKSEKEEQKPDNTSENSQQPSLQQPSLQQPSLQQPSLQQPSLQQPSLNEIACEAAENNDPDLVKTMLGKGADINFNCPPYDKTILYKAIENDNIELVKFLISQGANLVVSKYDDTALALALQNNNSELIDFFLNFEYTDKQLTKSLYIALQENYFALAKLLLNKIQLLGEDANKTYYDGYYDGSLLYLTISTAKENPYSLEMIQVLLNKGIDVNQGLYSNDTMAMWQQVAEISPLYLASYYNHVEIVKLLLAHGADVNADNKCFCDSYGEDCSLGGFSSKDFIHGTALDAAVKNNNLEIVKLLLAYGADVNGEN